MFESVEAIMYKHTVETSLKTIYVEGPSDLIFYNKCFQSIGICNVSICDISTVCTGNLDFKIHNLDPKSNRDKVIVFINETHIKNKLKFPLGIVDSDFDHVIGNSVSSKGLYATDTSCAEAYFWDKKSFIELFDRITKGLFCKNLGNIARALNSIFALRLVNREFCVTMSGNWIDKFEPTTGFKYKEYAKNIIIRDGRAKEIDTAIFCQKIDDVLEAIKETHIAINGHDMVDLLCHLVNKGQNKNIIKDPTILLDFIYSTDCYSSIVANPMFLSLKGQMSTAAK